MKIENWIERRHLAPRGNFIVSGLVNLALMLAVFMGLWYVFMDPRGIIRMYTPMYGYAYVQWLLVSVLTVHFVFRLWPFQRGAFLAYRSALLRQALRASCATAAFMGPGVPLFPVRLQMIRTRRLRISSYSETRPTAPEKYLYGDAQTGPAEHLVRPALSRSLSVNESLYWLPAADAGKPRPALPASDPARWRSSGKESPRVC